MPCRVLVIEDDPGTREMMAILLTLEGFDPVVARHGRDALEQLQEAPLPHVILLDLMMPVMDGWDFRQHQRRDPTISEIPVVVVSAAPHSTLQGLDPVAVLPKPLDYDRLISVVRANC